MSSFAKRIIPCLDVDNGRVVKGVNFVGLRDAGDPVEVAKRYNAEGADELTFLDITASHENRGTIVDIVKKVAQEVFIPLTVGGGIRKLEDIAIDVKRVHDGSYHVFVKGGREDTGLDALAWAKEVYDRGAGEILLTSMDTDGAKTGFELNITGQISKLVDIPVIASGGAGTMQHIKEAFECGASAALAASIFHFKEIDIMDLKRYLRANNIPVRI